MALKKFLFDFDFDAPERPVGLASEDDALEGELPEAEPPPPPPPTYSEEELKLARDQAYQSGREAGIQAAQGTAEQQLAKATQQIAVRLTELRDGLAKSQEEAGQFAVRVAATIARRAIPEMMRNGGADELAALVGQCLTRVIDHPRVLVRCHEQMAEPLRGRLDELARSTGYEGRLLVDADNRLNVGDLRVEWTDGGAERDDTKLWQEIDAAVAQAVGPLLEPPAAPAKTVDEAETDMTDTAAAAAEISEENGDA